MRTFIREIQLGIVFVLVVVAAIAGITLFAFRGVIVATDQHDDLRQRGATLQGLLSVMQDVETGQRGFLLTGDESYLVPYVEALERLNTEWASLAARDDLDAAALGRLRAAIDRKLAVATATIALKRAGDDAGVNRITLSGEGKAEMDAIRTEVAALQDETANELRAAQDRLDGTTFRASAAVVVLAVVVGVALLGAFVRLGVEAAARARAEAAREVAEADLRESEARYRGLFHTMNDAAIATDAERRVIDYNAAFTRTLGYEPGEFIGQSTRLLYESEAAWIEGGVLASRPGGGGLRTGFRRKSGEIFPAAVGLSTIVTDDGTRVGLLGVIRDMSAEAEQREQIESLNRDLDRRNNELTAAYAEMEAFSYSVSHDLRAPLRAVAGFTQVLQEDYADRLDADGMATLDRIRAAAARMARLIDDLLALSRISRADVRRQQVDLTAMARSVMAEVQRSDPGREVEWVIEEGVTAEGDPHLLRIALENLLGNAFKFTAKTAHPRIVFGSAGGPGAVREYYVRDNGAGFDMAYAGKLFSAFQRLHHADEFEGTGIGLATVHRILRKHGGTVRAEGKPGEGATITFSLGVEDTA